MSAGYFSWQGLGKPDYSRVASIIASLPSDVRQSLTKSAEECLRRVLMVEWTHAFRSGRGKAYAYCSQGYLAEKLGKCTRTVRRALELLQELGLQKITQRRPIGEIWQTNIYEPGARLLAIFYARRKTKKSNDLAWDKNVRQGPKEGTISAKGALIVEPKDDIRSADPTSLPFQLDAEGREVEVRGERQVEKGALTSLVKKVMLEVAEKKQANLESYDAARKAYWDRLGVLPPLR